MKSGSDSSPTTAHYKILPICYPLEILIYTKLPAAKLIQFLVLQILRCFLKFAVTHASKNFHVAILQKTIVISFNLSRLYYKYVAIL